MDGEWSDGEIRALLERIAMVRRQAELKVLKKRRQPRPLVPRRHPLQEAVVSTGGLAKKKRAAG